jgi:hypothetical protein
MSRFYYRSHYLISLLKSEFHNLFFVILTDLVYALLMKHIRSNNKEFMSFWRDEDSI